MMDEKDKSIERLFDEYADGLSARPDLARKAREKTHSRGREPARKKTIGIVFASLAGAAASIAVAVLSVNALLRVGGGIGDSDHDTPPPVAYATEYDITGVRAVVISRSAAAEYFDLDAARERYDIFAESYYACYLKDGGELVYVRGSFGVATESGTTQVSAIAEKAEYRRTDLKETFSLVISNGDRPVVAKNYVDGEYISQTYFGTDTTHYYVSTMGSDATAYSVAADLLPKAK